MLNKIYVKIKNYIKENLLFIIILITITIVLNIKLPYYINTPGGLMNVKNRIKIENGYEMKGSINLTYVSTYDATVLTMLISKFNKDWVVTKKKDVILPNENEIDDSNRNHILLKSGSQNAVIYAYKKANKKIELNNTKLYIIYIDEIANTTLKVGDTIEEIGGAIIRDQEDITNVIDKYNYEDEITIKTNNGIKKARVKNLDNEKKIGVLLNEISEIETEPKLIFNYNGNESGSSGGLMSALYIYNSLVETDITKGKKIAGTGTIDEDGNVGEIGSVSFKIMGAVKNKVDVFFVPKENYEEAMNFKQKKKYKLDIVMVEKFDDALNYLNNL